MYITDPERMTGKNRRIGVQGVNLVENGTWKLDTMNALDYSNVNIDFGLPILS